MKKNWIAKRRMRGLAIWELLIPIIFVIYLFLVFKPTYCQENPGNCDEYSKRVE